MPDIHKKALMFKYLTHRMRSAARRVNRFKIPLPANVALMASDAAIGVIKAGESLPINRK